MFCYNILCKASLQLESTICRYSALYYIFLDRRTPPADDCLDLDGRPRLTGE